MIDPWVSSLKTEKIFEEDETLPEPVEQSAIVESEKEKNDLYV